MKKIFITTVILILGIQPVFACDPCALFNAARLQGHNDHSWSLGVSEQYTSFEKSKFYPENSRRNNETVKGFSTTQFAASYDLSDRLGVQINIPMIARYAEQVKNFRASDELDLGLGDISVIGNYSLLNIKELEYSLLAGMTAGVKLPTGETGVLEEISASESEELTRNAYLKHHPVGSASGGRALAFGSGSYDYILGTNALYRYQKYLFLTNLQYTIRTEGDFSYEFDNDLIWSVLPAYYFVLGDAYTLAGGLSLSGEHKGKDRLHGQEVSGSSISNLYLGPEMILTFVDKLSAQCGFDFRVSNKDQNADIVPEHRLRVSLAWRF